MFFQWEMEVPSVKSLCPGIKTITERLSPHKPVRTHPQRWFWHTFCQANTKNKSHCPQIINHVLTTAFYRYATKLGLGSAAHVRKLSDTEKQKRVFQNITKDMDTNGYCDVSLIREKVS